MTEAQNYVVSTPHFSACIFRSESRERGPKFEDKVIKAFESGEFREFKGKETVSGERMAPIREAFRRLVNRIHAAPVVVSTDMGHLKGLSKRQYDIFTRKRILDDLTWRKKDLPDAELPWGLTDEALKKEHERFTRLAEKDPKITEALKREGEIQAKLNAEMIKYAEELGWGDLAKKLYVSRGTSLWNGFPMRLFDPAEITLLVLHSSGKVQDQSRFPDNSQRK